MRKKPTGRLKYGVGVNDGKYPTEINDKAVKHYSLWDSILCRCYCERYHTEKPTYIGCEVSDNFKNYSFFYEWCEQQIGFGNNKWQIDKDLLVKGNKQYSEDTCVFVPPEINAFLTLRKRDRGKFPIGVSALKGKIKATCNANGICNNLGFFENIEDAFKAYKSFKESHAKVLAARYKDIVDTRVTESLLNFEVSIDD